MVICLKRLLDCLLICTYSSAHVWTQQRKYPHYFLWIPLYSRKLWIQTLHSWIVKGNSKLNPSVSIIFCLSAFMENGQDYLSVLIFMQGADHLTLEGGRGRLILEKKFSASACREKKIACSKNVIESLWEKKGKNILPTRLLEKKFLMSRNQPPPAPSPSRFKWSVPKWRA